MCAPFTRPPAFPVKVWNRQLASMALNVNHDGFGRRPSSPGFLKLQMAWWASRSRSLDWRGFGGNVICVPVQWING